jgi:hypothetical protein
LGNNSAETGKKKTKKRKEEQENPSLRERESERAIQK